MNRLLLQSGEDIPFPEARISVHQPKIKEISRIGEEEFRIGSQFLNLSRDDFEEEDKKDLSDKSDFEILMAIINGRESYKYKRDVEFILTLLFPNYEVSINKEDISIRNESFVTSINKVNFNNFRIIISEMFCLASKRDKSGAGAYNPANEHAKKLAEKFKKAEEKRNQLKGKTNEDKSSEVAILSSYISILSVGLMKDKNSLMNYTIPQLYDEFERFILREEYEMYIKAKLAGASDVEEVENWMKNIHV